MNMPIIIFCTKMSDTTCGDLVSPKVNKPTSQPVVQPTVQTAVETTFEILPVGEIKFDPTARVVISSNKYVNASYSGSYRFC